MESVKKQADAIAELESEIVKAKTSEKESEATLSQLQAEVDTLERENAKLKQAAPSDKGGKFGRSYLDFCAEASLIAGPSADAGEYTTFTGSLETSHLVSQVS